MPITSLVLECRPSQLEALVAQIERFPCASVAHRHQHALVVVTDTLTQLEDRALVNALAGLEGVLVATPVFTAAEDGEALRDWRPLTPETAALEV